MPKFQEENIEDKGIRLNRYLANSGVCNRREADKLIAKGLVTVNGKVVTEMGYRVQSGEKVVYEGQERNAEAKQYILVNKPKDYSLSDKRKGRARNIYDIIEYACWEKVAPADAIGTASTGLVLMTNDLDVVNKINHKKHFLFHLFLDQEVSLELIDLIKRNAELKTIKGKILDVQYANPENKTELGIETNGLDENDIYNIIKHLNLRIERIDRVMLAGLTKKNLPRGKWRFLSKKEIQFLKMQ